VVPDLLPETLDGCCATETDLKVPERTIGSTAQQNEMKKVAVNRRSRKWLIAAAAASAALIVIGAVTLFARDDATEPQSPAAPATTEAPAAVAAEEVAREFLDAYGAFDADLAMTYLTDDFFSKWRPAEEFRLEIAHFEAIGYQQMINNCELRNASASDISFRCGFDLHAIRSDEIGRGPYTDNYWDLTIRDGEIISAEWSWAYRANGFSREMWEPFAEWVSTEYPEDAAVMYTDGTHTAQLLSDESIRLWDQHTREYAAAHTPTGS
jgi:hypothetical protein